MPLAASARVPYQSKPRAEGSPATNEAGNSATATASSDPAPAETALPIANNGIADEPAVPPLGVVDQPASPPDGGDEQAAAGATCSASATSSLPTLGTAVHWMPSPDEAVKLAEKERKLVFLIQVSGNFAKEEFT
jgi:hypothetical protein